MKQRYVDSEVPYIVRLAISLKVNHGEHFIFKTSKGNPTYSFAYTLHDAIEYRFPESGLTISAKEGETLFIPKGLPHSTVYCSADSTVIVYQFDFEGELPAKFHEPILMSEEASAFFRDFADPYDSPDCLKCTARIYDLLSLLLRENELPPRKYRRLLPALEAFEKHPSDRHNIAHYAKLCNMSESGFRRTFKDCTGQTPVEYRNTLRLQIARNLIRFSDYSVEEAAERSGFTNLSFFYRLYKRTYGIKPGDT